MTSVELDQVEATTGVQLPESFRVLVISLNLDDVGPQGMEFMLRADCLVEINQQIDISQWLEGFDLEESGMDLELDEVEHFFAFAGDGCGNYFFLDPDEEDPSVYFLCHDPVSFDDTGMTLSSIRKELEDVRSMSE